MIRRGLRLHHAHNRQPANGKLERLKRYNALHVPTGYFMDAMVRLREKYLNVPLEAVIHPASTSARGAAIQQQAAALAPQPCKRSNYGRGMV
jgi:hypothetical protein